MKRSVKAALFSCFVFPGVGHIILKQYVRGIVFIVPTMIGLVYVVNYSIQKALSVLDKIKSGAVPLDTASITELITTTPSGSENTMLNIAMLVIVVFWAAGIIDSYRIGHIEDKNEAHNNMKKQPR